MVGSAIIGGVLLALIEGMGILFMRYSSEQFRPVNPLEDPAQLGPMEGGGGGFSNIGSGGGISELGSSYSSDHSSSSSLFGSSTSSSPSDSSAESKPFWSSFFGGAGDEPSSNGQSNGTTSSTPASGPFASSQQFQ